MEKFNKIIEHLEVSCVVFIENDFEVENIESSILARYSILSARNKSLLIQNLRKNSRSELADNLVEFDSEFAKLKLPEGSLAYLKTGEWDNFLVTLPPNDISVIAAQVISKITLNPESKRIFFQYGIVSNFPDNYKPFFEQIIGNNLQYSVLIFDDIIPVTLEEFQDDLLITLNGTKIFSVIADNKLGSGDNQGLRIITEFIKNISDENSLIAYSVIFTSQSLPNDSREFGSGYYQSVIKSENGVYDISKALTLIAFSNTFTYLQKKIENSVRDIPNIIQSNKQNIAYIVDKANAEGMLPYEAIHIWYENALNFLLNKSFVEDTKPNFTSAFGLSKLFDKSFLIPDTELSEDFRDISGNELFDCSVNAKHLPIAPGDIFFSEKRKYFVLTGQTCDLSIRSSTKERTAQVGELLRSEYKSVANIASSYANLLKVEKEHKDVVNSLNKKIGRLDSALLFKGFKHNNDFGYLEVKHTTKSLRLVDFSILDLCMYNDNGNCSIDLNKELSLDLINYISDIALNRYSEIKSNLNELIGIHFDVRSKIENKMHGLLTYNQEENVINFPYRRVCRIKGDFNKLLHHNYWHYRSRVDLNEINLVQ